MQRKSSSSVKVFYPKYDKQALLSLIKSRLPRLAQELDLKRVVLFGSYAEGRHTVASDIDLMVVYGGEERGDAYSLVKRRLDIHGLEPHVYGEDQYSQMRPTIQRMIQNGISLLED